MPEENDQQEVEEDNFGYTLEGSWDDIVDFGESISDAFHRSDVKDETAEEWDSWRPRNEEEHSDLREKTVEKAKMDEGDDAGRMADAAAEHLSKSREKTVEGDLGEAAENVGESAKSAGKAMEGAGRDAIRKVEDVVYRHIAKTNPLYFDSEDFNASLESLSSAVGDRVKQALNGEDEEERQYRLTINPESEGVEEALGEEFEEKD